MLPRTLEMLALSAMLLACSNQASLTVDLRSDFAGGVEIVDARATLSSGERVVSSELRALGVGSLVGGARVAELRELPPGAYLVRVDALGPDGELVGTRTVSVALAGDTSVTVVLSRDCTGVLCPSATDSADATECYHGRCVPRACAPGSASCGRSGCTSASDCDPPSAACARAECLDGECFAVEIGRSCASGEVCVPSSGCIPVTPPSDAGGRDAALVEAALVDVGGETCACDDGNPCTHSDTCSAGSCAGTGYSCTPAPCMTSVCDGRGGCTTGGGCGPTTVCDGTGCVGCGGADQPCCDAEGCNPGLWCYTSVCTCAQPGGPCCPWDGSCADGSTCVGGTCCFVAGGTCGQCCAGSRCADGTCVPG